jgi:exosortase
VIITRALGVPLYREGFVIYLPEINLLVNDGCSGIRYLLSFFTFSIVYAALFKERNLVRLAVVLASLPLSIFAGIARLSIIFLSAYYISPVLAEHRPHVILSWLVFAFFLSGAIGIDQYVSRKKKSASSITHDA